MRIVLSICVALLLGVVAGPAEASLILEGPATQTGVGVGTVLTILTLGSPGSSPNASGCVAWGGSADAVGGPCFGTGIQGGDEQSGASQTRTVTLGEAGITSAEQLRIVLRPNEPNSLDAHAITLDQLVLRIFGSDGAILFTSTDWSSPVVIPDADPMHPESTGFVFKLSSDDLANAIGAFSSANNHIGLAASLSDAAGGQDYFYVSQAASGIPPADTPEPVSCVLVGAGLVALGLVRRNCGGALLKEAPWAATRGAEYRPARPVGVSSACPER